MENFDIKKKIGNKKKIIFISIEFVDSEMQREYQFHKWHIHKRFMGKTIENLIKHIQDGIIKKLILTTKEENRNGKDENEV